MKQKQAHGLKRLAERVRAGGSPDHIDVYATGDGPAVLISGLGSDVFIPLEGGREVTSDPDAFREHGEDALLVGVARERIGLWGKIYSRVHSVNLVSGFSEAVDNTVGDPIVNAEYIGIHEGVVNPTQHNHLHLVADVDVDTRYFLFDVE